MMNIEPRQHTRDRALLRAELFCQVDAIESILRDCADDAETIGTLPEPAWRALHEAGLFRLKAPAELGGIEADPVTAFEVLERLAYIDTSAGWTAMVGAGTLSVMSGWLPDDGIGDLLIDGRLPRVIGALMPTGRATQVTGGYALTGRWQFGSGSKHAEWASGAAIVESADPRLLSFVFPMSDVTVHDNWDVNALKGTGSCDFSVQSIFIPDSHVCNVAEPAARGGAAFRMGPAGLFANEHAAFALGTARRALDETIELAKSKTRGYIAPQGVAARGKFQYDLGRCDLTLIASRALVIDAYERAFAAAQANECATNLALQTELRCAAVNATQAAVEVCRSLFSYAGARSLYRGNVIERCLRDVQAAAQHGVVNDAAYEDRGRLLLGLDDVAPLR